MRIVLVSLVLAWPLFAQEPASAPAAASDSGAVAQPAPAARADSGGWKSAETLKKATEPIAITNPVFDKLTLGGTFQLQGFYHDMDDNDDQNKTLSLTLSKFRLDLAAEYNDHFGLLGQFLLQANAHDLGIENAYAYYKQGEFQVTAGKLLKPFSMEATQDNTQLYTVDRGQLYSTFLTATTGYALYDVGVTLKGGFEDEGTEVTYEGGVFNGKQNDDSTKNYSGAQYVTQDAGFRAKDFAGRVALKGFAGLEAELAFSTKTAERLAAPGDLSIAFNTAYEASLAYERMGWRFQGELAWGDNDNGLDSNIVNGTSSQFIDFYTMLIWHHDYSRGRASEVVVKWEGLDPTMTWSLHGTSTPNDGKFLYTGGVNYFFTPKISLLCDYGVLEPVTKIPGADHLTQNLDALWRLNF